MTTSVSSPDRLHPDLAPGAEAFVHGQFVFVTCVLAHVSPYDGHAAGGYGNFGGGWDEYESDVAPPRKSRVSRLPPPRPPQQKKKPRQQKQKQQKQPQNQMQQQLRQQQKQEQPRQRLGPAPPLPSPSPPTWDGQTIPDDPLMRARLQAVVQGSFSCDAISSHPLFAAAMTQHTAAQEALGGTQDTVIYSVGPQGKPHIYVSGPAILNQLAGVQAEVVWQGDSSVLRAPEYFKFYSHDKSIMHHVDVVGAHMRGPAHPGWCTFFQGNRAVGFDANLFWSVALLWWFTGTSGVKQWDEQLATLAADPTLLNGPLLPSRPQPVHRFKVRGVKAGGAQGGGANGGAGTGAGAGGEDGSKRKRNDDTPAEKRVKVCWHSPAVGYHANFAPDVVVAEGIVNDKEAIWRAKSTLGRDEGRRCVPPSAHGHLPSARTTPL